MTTTFDNLLWMNDVAVNRIMGILDINTVEHRVPGSPSSRQEKLYFWTVFFSKKTGDTILCWKNPNVFMLRYLHCPPLPPQLKNSSAEWNIQPAVDNNKKCFKSFCTMFSITPQRIPTRHIPGIPLLRQQLIKGHPHEILLFSHFFIWAGKPEHLWKNQESWSPKKVDIQTYHQRFKETAS